MNAKHPAPNILWFLPTHGDAHDLGTAAGAREIDFGYLREIALAADRLGYFGVLLPTDRGCEDSWVVASAISTWTKRLRYLVSIDPRLQSPSAAARMTATFDRLTNGRLLINVVTGGGGADDQGDESVSGQDERHAATRTFLDAYRGLLADASIIARDRHGVASEDRHLDPPLYFGESSDAAVDVATDAVDKILLAGEPPDQVAAKIARLRATAQNRGRKLSFGIRLHVIVRDTNEAAWQAADDLIQHHAEQPTASARLARGPADPGRTDRGGAGTALVGDPRTVAARIRAYQDIGIDTFIMSGSPHLEEVYRFAELVFPLLSVQRHARAAPLHVNTGRFGKKPGDAFRPAQRAS